jgi:predicted O-linked N-acetylglucosamine transferase (SPINDLY family)
LERDVAPATVLPAKSNGYVTFGSFNNAIKLNNLTVKTWARILITVPHSRLILKWLEFDKAGSSTILDRFEKLGVDPTRIERQGWAGDPYSPYQQIDICLDPILASGGTTTCDALWMGVPVITYAGESVFSRTGLMHMSNIGLPDLIATEVDQYVQIAENLATDIQCLTNIRLGLRERMQQSPIMDEVAYCEHLATEFRRIWRHWCDA